MNRLIQLKKTTSLSVRVLLLVCFGLAPLMRAVVPPPDGDYPNFTTAEGQNALLHLTTGAANTAVGWFSLDSITTGSFNTAVGAGTLVLNSGDENTAIGAATLLLNTASGNTAVGSRALLNNTTGGTLENPLGLILGPNVAVGEEALESNMITSANTAVGYQALRSFTSGPMGLEHAGLGTAVGFQTLANATGESNTAIGYAALRNCTTGRSNTALGFEAGLNVTTASSVICIGAGGDNVEASCYIGNISGESVDPVTATAVFVQNNGKLGTVLSSRRFKRDIKPMDKASEAILALEPVTFHYKADPKGTPCFGLIAEDVAKADPDLVIRGKDDELLSVRYDQVNAMLLNEFLKEHKKVQKLEATVAEQQKRFAEQARQIETLASVVQKVSDQMELAKPTPHMARNKTD